MSLVLDGGLYRQDAFIKVRSVVLDKESVGSRRGCDSGDSRKAGIGNAGRYVVFGLTGWDAAVGGRGAFCNPIIQVVQHSAQQGRNVQRVGRVLEGIVVGAVDVVGAVLRGGKEVDAGALVVGQVVAEGVGVGERAAALPVFGGGLGVDDEGVGVRSFEDTVGFASEGVGGDWVGVGKLVGRVEVVVVLSRVPAGLGETVVDEYPSSTGDKGRYTGKDLPAVSILVEAPIGELPEKAGALGAAPAVGFFDADAVAPEGIGLACGNRTSAYKRKETRSRRPVKPSPMTKGSLAV